MMLEMIAVGPILIALTLAVGCGRIAFDPLEDGGHVLDDAIVVPPCEFGPWSTPRRQVALSTPFTEWEPALHPDGLVVAFVSDRAGTMDLYLAQRLSPADDFGAPSPVLSTALSETDPVWAGAGDQLHFSRNDGTDKLVYVADYAGGAFGTATASDLPAIGFGHSLSPDGREVFYGVQVALNEWDLEHATRVAVGAPWEVDTLLTPFNRVGITEGWPGFDAVTQTLYFEVYPGPMIVRTHREQPGQPFGPFEAVGEVNAGGNSTGDPEVSADGKTIMFSSERTGGAGADDIYLSTRDCL